MISILAGIAGAMGGLIVGWGIDYLVFHLRMRRLKRELDELRERHRSSRA